MKGGWIGMMVALMVGGSLPGAPPAGGKSDSGSGLTTYSGCRLVKAEWSDGDSFPVRFPDGVERTIRLYGADCFEWHVSDSSDARRLRAQRRYFGISGFGGTPMASIAKAKGFGKAAADLVAELLGEPFLVHTAFADARGDGRYKRFYGFVTTADGKDVAAELVGAGLARAFGVYRKRPDRTSHEEYKQRLVDLELRAASTRRGAWSATNWEQLPEERRVEREEEAELEAARDGAATLLGDKIDPNTASRDRLMALPGVGEVTANRIIEGRAHGVYRKAQDLLRVQGIGPKTLARFREYLRFADPGGVSTHRIE